jgi:hypothetical protein
MFCSNCGHNFGGNAAKFCSECGAPAAVSGNQGGQQQLAANKAERDEKNSVLYHGIMDIFMGGLWVFTAIWLSGQSFARGAPQALWDGTYMYWVIIVGLLWIGAGITCIGLRNDKEKYGIIMSIYIFALAMFIIFLFMAGFEVISFVGGFMWILLIVPLADLFFIIRLAMLRQTKG